MVVERTAETGEKAIVIVLCLISSTFLVEQEDSDPISRLSEDLSTNATFSSDMIKIPEMLNIIADL